MNKSTLFHMYFFNQKCSQRLIVDSFESHLVAIHKKVAHRQPLEYCLQATVYVR